MRKALAVSIIIISILLASNLYLLTSREEHTFTMNTIVKVYINDQLVYVKKGDMFNTNMEYFIRTIFDEGSYLIGMKNEDGASVNFAGVNMDTRPYKDNITEIRRIYAITDSGWSPTKTTVVLPDGSILLDAEYSYTVTEYSDNTIEITIIKYKLFEDTATIYGSALGSKLHYSDPTSGWKDDYFLFCVDKFDSAITVNAGDVLKIEYDIVINP